MCAFDGPRGSVVASAARVTQSSPVEQTMEFSREVAGFLIGKKGISVRAVSKKANVRIDSRDEGRKRIFTVRPNRKMDEGAVKEAMSIMTEAAKAYQNVLSGDAGSKAQVNDENEIVIQGVTFTYQQNRSQGSRRRGGGDNGNGFRGGNNYNNNANGFSRPNNGRGRGRGSRGSRGGRGGRGGRMTEKVIEKKRSARAQRRELRESKVQRSTRQEIFEIPEEGMAISKLAVELAVDPTEIVKVLFLNGKMASVNQIIDKESVTLVAEHYGVEVGETNFSPRPKTHSL